MFGPCFFMRLVGLELLFNLVGGSTLEVIGGGRIEVVKLGIFPASSAIVGGDVSGRVGGSPLGGFVSLEERKLLKVVSRVVVARGGRSEKLKFR